MPCVVTEVENCALYESRDKESVDGVIESDVKSAANQFSCREFSCADEQVGSECELSAGVKEVFCIPSPSEVMVVDGHEQLNLGGRFGEHERAGDVVPVKGRLARNISFWRDIVQASPHILAHTCLFLPTCLHHKSR